MILLDSNIFMYAAGATHPAKGPCLQLLKKIASGDVDAGIDTEVLQEILHRYRSIHRWEDGKRVYDLARKIISNVIPVDVRALDAARKLMDQHLDLMARDALHASICQLSGASAICSYDKDFDQVTGLTRLEPPDVS
jgi:uncharacterized protein